MYSIPLKKYYVGVFNNVADCLQRHNGGQSLSTKAGVPWNLIYSIECINKAAAMKLEKKIKSRGIKRYMEDNNIFAA